MPAVVSISNIKKPSKDIKGNLNFEVGETFKGRIEKDDKSGNITVKLMDGWQFEAEIQNDTKNALNGTVKFQVTGVENGKIKLSIIEENSYKGESKEDVLESFIKKEGLLKSDLDIVKNLIKFSMKIDKDTVINIRNLFKLKNEISNNSDNFNKFLNSILESKGVRYDSAEGKNIEKILKDFLNVFQELTKEDIYLMVENKIDLDKYNIKSLIKFSNNKENINDVVKNLNVINDKDVENNLKDSIIKILKELSLDEIKEFSSVLIKNSPDKQVANNVKGLLDNLNTCIDNKSKQNIINNFLDNLSDREVNDLIINIKLNKNLIFGIKNKINKILNNENINLDNNLNKETEMRSLNENKDIIKISNGGKNVGEVYLNNVSKNNLLEALKYINENSIKTHENGNKFNIKESSFKELLNDKFNINNEPRFTDTNVLKELINKAQMLNLPINELSKNDIEEAINNILKNNLKLTEDEAINIKNISKELFGNEEILESVKNAILDSSTEKISKSNFIKFINKEVKVISQDIKFIELSEDIKVQIANNLKDSREVLKNLLNKEGGIPLGLDSQKLSDIKVFNSLSQNYYILDIPVKAKNENYECKLFIKDDRKTGKKVDSKNVNMVITVKTINMGTIDSFLKVNNNDLNINIKCEQKAINIIDYSKDLLLKALKDKNYNVKIQVSKREEEVLLKNCIEFFNDKKVGMIDTRV